MLRIDQILHGIKGISKALIGIKKTPDELRELRSNICSKCKSLQINENIGYWKCGECHCLLDFKLKIADEYCPLGKWENGYRIFQKKK